MARVNILDSGDHRHYLPRFMAVGVVSTLLDVVLFTVLHLAFGVPTLAANTFSYSAGIVNSYLLHRRWTFSDRPRQPFGRQFSQFLVVSVSALLLNNLIVLLFTPPLGALLQNAAFGAVAAKLAATGMGMVWNYLANSIWTFAEVDK